ncbi:Uncharacterised protein [Acinetobacter baumannii]|nr:Uncharacterised protein [Acinetobacter baumannii]
MSVCSDSSIVGSATLTMLISSDAINVPRQMAATSEILRIPDIVGLLIEMGVIVKTILILYYD